MSIQRDNGGTVAGVREQGREKGYPILGSDLCFHERSQSALHTQPSLKQNLLPWLREATGSMFCQYLECSPSARASAALTLSGSNSSYVGPMQVKESKGGLLLHTATQGRREM